MEILITGGAGYLGSVMIPELLNEGHKVIIIDNFMFNQASLLDCCHNENLSIIRGDARNKSLIQGLIKKADVILPLACLTGAPICSQRPMEAKSIIIDGVKLILELKSKDQMIIYPTTNSGYGVGQKDIYCTEETELNPISLYGKLKVEAEKILLDGGNSITLRLATAFGVSPRMRLDLLVNDFTYRAINDRFIVLFEAHFKRNFIHVRDVARAFIYCIDNFEAMKNEPYNVGLSDANLSKWELCEEINKQVNDFYFIEAKIGEDPDKRDYIVSNKKIESMGFKAKYSLQKGITELIKGYQIVQKNQFTNI